MNKAVRGVFNSARRLPLLFSCLAFAGCLGAGEAVTGRTWFVSTSGCDENPGTEGEPFLTLQRAADVAEPGDTVSAAPGQYPESVVFPRSGKAGAPITFRGARGPGGEWLTVLDRSAPVSGWEPAPEVGDGVFRADLGFNPACLTLGGKLLARVNDRHMAREPGDLRGGFNLMSLPAGEPLLGSDRVPPIVTHAYNTEEHLFWDGLRALYGYRDGLTYIRFRDGDDPRGMELLATPAGAGFVISDRAHIVIRDFAVRGAEISIEISGPEAVGNLVENNRLVHGRMRVRLTRGASGNIVRGNEMTLDYYGHDRPGAWGGTGRPTMATSLAGYVYRTFKYVVGYNSSDDRGVQIDGAGEGNEIVGNRIYGGLIGVNSRHTRGMVIRDNLISEMSSIGYSPASGTRDAFFHDNLVSNCNINIRFHALNDPGAPGHRLFVYRNRLFLPPGVGHHIFCHVWHEDNENPPPLEISFYHNTLAGGHTGLQFPTRIPEMPGFRLVNNLVAAGRSVYTILVLLENPGRVGMFDHNWIGGPQAGYRWPVAWFGENNIIARGENPWPPGEMPDFRLPEGHPARGAGLDLSAPFSYRGETHAPLPGMEPGYFAGPAPDIGAVQHRD